jgi:uncharacterized membrane protein (UPF0127 family)
MRLETADTLWKKARGLMFRKPLGDDEGMLFVFGKECRPMFWMFGMRFPVDMLFLDSERKVVDVKRGCRPMSLDPRTWRMYVPKKPAKYALEVNAGTADAVMRRISGLEGLR